MNKNKIDKIVIMTTKYIGIALLMGLLFWAICYLWQNFKYEQTNDAQVDAYLSPINVKVGGYISKIFYKDNQYVHQGDTLVLIEKDEYWLKREAAAAELQSSRAKLPILAANEETQSKNIAVISAQLTGAQAKLDQQHKEYERYKSLLAEESTTQQKFDIVNTALISQQSDYAQIQASLQAAAAKLKDIQAQRAAIAAEINIKTALLDRQELDLRYTVIKAPFDGRIGKKNIQQGQLVQPGQTLAFLLNEADKKWVIANFKETQIKSFYIGQQVSIKADAYPDEVFLGVIESLSPTTGARYSLLPPDNATGNFVKITQRIPVRIELTDAPRKLEKLSPGMNANVYILSK